MNVHSEPRERAGSRRGAPTRALGTALLAALLGACAPGSPAAAPPSWPSGTVLAVDGVPILEEEVDAALIAVAIVSAESVDAQQRRLALNNVVLPRHVAALEWPEERAAARERIEELAAADPIGPPGPHGEYFELVEGGYNQIGLVVFGAVMQLGVGETTEILEEPGCFLIARVLERNDGPVMAATSFRLDVRRACYHPMIRAEFNVDELLSRHELTIVDPRWRTIVPEHIQYRMGVHDQ